MGLRRSSNRLCLRAEAVNFTAARWGCVQACCWVDVHGEHATTPAELAQLLSKNPAGKAAELYDIDHVFTPKGGEKTAGVPHNCVQTAGAAQNRSFHRQYRGNRDASWLLSQSLTYHVYCRCQGCW